MTHHQLIAFVLLMPLELASWRTTLFGNKGSGNKWRANIELACFEKNGQEKQLWVKKQAGTKEIKYCP